MAEEEKINLERFFFDLSPQEQAFVVRESERVKEVTPTMIELFGRSGMFLGLRRNGQLISFVSYKLSQNKCFINWVWGLAPRGFIVKYRGSPAEIVLDELIRKKARVFTAGGVTPVKGKGFFERQIRRGLLQREIVPEIALGFKVTKKGLRQAYNRRPFG